MNTIFCPSCRELILGEMVCSACGWRRPPAIEGTEVWQTNIGERLPFPSYPIIAQKNYCLVTEQNTIIALDIVTGKVAWKYLPFPDCGVSGICSNGSLLFVSPFDKQPVPTGNKMLLALDARTGTEVWSFPFTAHSISTAAVFGDIIYFTASNNHLYAIDSKKGERIWSVGHPYWGPSAPAVGAELVVVGGRGTELVAYEATSGTIRWRFTGESWFVPTPQMSAPYIFATNWDGLLYALDMHSGECMWRRRGERGRGFTTLPFVANDILLIGSRVNRQADVAGSYEYALVALRASDGEPLWRYDLQQSLQTTPDIVEDSLLLATSDGVVAVLQRATGVVQWQAKVGEQLVAQPQVSDDLMLLAERDGTCRAVRWRQGGLADILPPDTYLQRGDYEMAAVAFALKGDYAESAALYERQLNQLREAALLYQCAGTTVHAAELWEQLGEIRRAADLYSDTGNLPRLAALLARSGQQLRAAQIYEQARMLDQAAQLYEQSGDRAHAAELYKLVGKSDVAQAIWESLGAWERLVEYLIEAQKLGEAAMVLVRYGQRERAAQLYEEATMLDQALLLRIQLEHWEHVIPLATALEQYESAAMALERIGQMLAAAEAYEHAAQHYANAATLDHMRVADLYEHAAHLYSSVYEEERASSSLRQILRYRQLPEIVIHAEPQGSFAEYEWNSLGLRIENSGYGPAFAITITIRGQFELDDVQPISLLIMNNTVQREMLLRPLKEQYGKVPLELIVTYRDGQGKQYELVKRLFLTVARYTTITPQSIDISYVSTRPADEVEQQLQLLTNYRRTLEKSVQQLALRGGEAFADVGLLNSIDDSRQYIRNIKRWLRARGVNVEDNINDE